MAVDDGTRSATMSRIQATAWSADPLIRGLSRCFTLGLDYIQGIEEILRNGGSGESVLCASIFCEEGQGLVEYALILVLVAIVVIAILALVGPAVGNVFSNIIGSI